MNTTPRASHSLRAASIECTRSARWPPAGEAVVLHHRVVAGGGVDFEHRGRTRQADEEWWLVTVGRNANGAKRFDIPIAQGGNVARRQSDVFDGKVHVRELTAIRAAKHGELSMRRPP